MYFCSTQVSVHYDFLSRLHIWNWLLYIETFIPGTSLTDIQRYNYILCCISLYANFHCPFIISSVVIHYMTYNAQIRHSQYFCNMPIHRLHRISFLIWPQIWNRKQYIDFRHSNLRLISHVHTNIWLANLICTCRVYVLRNTYIGIFTLWYKLTLLVYLQTI